MYKYTLYVFALCFITVSCASKTHDLSHYTTNNNKMQLTIEEETPILVISNNSLKGMSRNKLMQYSYYDILDLLGNPNYIKESIKMYTWQYILPNECIVNFTWNSHTNNMMNITSYNSTNNNIDDCYID